jgi:hypothetical protein
MALAIPPRIYGGNMNRFNLASAAGLFVLAFGLASCSQDQTTKDSYKAPPPLIVTGKGQQGLLQWERSSDKTLDLQDAFDVSAGHPARTEVLARCMRDKTSFSEKFSVNGQQPIKIFQVVPHDVLFEDLNKAAITCDWEVSLFNETGSRHVIRLPTSPLADCGKSEVILENTANNDKIKLVQILKTSGVKVRYRNSLAASAEIACRDVLFGALPFEKVLELSQIDLRRPIYRERRNEASVAQTPLQPCRILISEAGQVKQMSYLMTIHIPRRPLEIQLTKTFAPPIWARLNYFTNPIGIADIAIRNSTDVSRVVQIPRLLNLKLNVILGVHKGMTIDVSSPTRSTVNVPWMTVQVLTPVKPLKDEPAGWTIAIPPQSALTLRLLYKDGYGGCFRTDERFTGFSIPAQPLTINEIMPTGEQIEAIDILTPEVWWNMTPEQFQNTPLRLARCL